MLKFEDTAAEKALSIMIKENQDKILVCNTMGILEVLSAKPK
ncbi:hypothetical protein [Candidatus Nitrosocosmicus sp. T]